MNPNWTDAQNWLDIVDHIWIGLVLIAAAAVPSWFAARNHRTITDIKNQVVNGHDKPMREDLDRAIAAIEALAKDVTGLRDEVAMEENRRRAQIDEVFAQLNRMKRR